MLGRVVPQAAPLWCGVAFHTLVDLNKLAGETPSFPEAEGPGRTLALSCVSGLGRLKKEGGGYCPSEDMMMI